MFYKLTEIDGVIKQIETSDTLQDGYIELSPHIMSNYRGKSIANLVQEHNDYLALLEKQRLAKELAKQQLLANMASVQPTDTNENIEIASDEQVLQ